MDFDRVSQRLQDLGYKVSCFETAAEAAEYLNNQIDGQTVGFGGSVTLPDMGLYDSLSAHNQVVWHWRVPEGKTADDMRREAAAAQVYISSVNGLAETGEIINIDGNGNRLASMLYGHEKVWFVVGENKLAPDYESALYRARNTAAPLNAKRLGSKTPCAVSGDRCYNCQSPGRICRALSVLWASPRSCAFEVVLIHESLGF